MSSDQGPRISGYATRPMMAMSTVLLACATVAVLAFAGIVPGLPAFGSGDDHQSLIGDRALPAVATTEAVAPKAAKVVRRARTEVRARRAAPRKERSEKRRTVTKAPEQRPQAEPAPAPAPAPVVAEAEPERTPAPKKPSPVEQVTETTGKTVKQLTDTVADTVDKVVPGLGEPIRKTGESVDKLVQDLGRGLAPR